MGLSLHGPDTMDPPLITASNLPRSASTPPDVDRGVPIDDQQVGQLAGGDRAELVAPAHQLRAVPGSPAHDVEGWNADDVDVEGELLAVDPVGEADGSVVVTEHQSHTRFVRPGNPTPARRRDRP